MRPALYVGQQVADALKNNMEENLQRYREGDFSDLEQAGNWRIPLSVQADLESLDGLVPEAGVESELANSMLVGTVLEGLSPSLAREERLWIRLSHIEALEYARGRWLKEGASDDALLKQVKAHFFAPSLTSCRDDHAVARLWWNYHIAGKIMPDDPERALTSILARADIRMALIERPGIGARPSLAKAVVLMLENEKTGLKGDESLFRAFMKRLNLKGAGIVFEVWSENRVFDFMLECLEDVG